MNILNNNNGKNMLLIFFDHYSYLHFLKIPNKFGNIFVKTVSIFLLL